MSRRTCSTLRRIKNEGQVPVDLGLADEDGYSRSGVIQSVDKPRRHRFWDDSSPSAVRQH